MLSKNLSTTQMLNVPQKNCIAYFLILLAFTLLKLPVTAQKGDFQVNIPLFYQTPKVYKKVEVRTFYLKMRDGVEIACDLILPANLPAGEKIPTILHQTRYWRSASLRWPFSALAPAGCPSLNPLTNSEDIVKAGYAMLSVDVRGSGASFGYEILPMGAKEVADGKALMDWIVAQPWSDGKIGTIGISYNGWAGQMLVTTGHPALKAMVTVNSPFDGYDDMAVPGGVINRGLLATWADILRHCDRGEMYSSQRFLKRIVKGPKAVKGRFSALDSVYLDHKKNGYADELLRNIVGRDDILPGVGNKPIDAFFPVGYLAQINQANIPVYAIDGWYDMANAHAAARIFRNYGGGQNKLLIGPWNHFLAQNVSPFAPGKTEFDYLSEVMKFFDYHLKGKQTGLKDEPAVHYFTLGEEKWNSSATWPPIETKAQGWFLGKKGALLPYSGAENGSNMIQVDTMLSLGDQTRWDLSARNHTTYAGLDTLQKHWLTFTSPPLNGDMKITGHPSLRVFI
ncbi:MAG TPA: CocE/NonD family hydrolase, partial [Bacteroidetes bacterium]|nr:CocE/NonD family hydrolase [Bacteroidota bacterium]